MKRIVWAIILSLPLALLAFAISDSAKCPELLRNILSPGNLVALHVPPAYGSLADTISRFVTVTLATDVAYYALILWSVLTCFAGRGGSPENPTKVRSECP